jgi:hypothetical protein
MLRCIIRISSHDVTHHQHLPLSNTTTPHHPTSQHLNPSSLSYYNILPPSRRSFCVSQRLRLSVTHFFPHHQEGPSVIPKYLRTFQRGDSIPPLGSRPSESIVQWSRFPWISLMEFSHCLQPVDKRRWLPGKRIITRLSNKVL